MQNHQFYGWANESEIPEEASLFLLDNLPTSLHWLRSGLGPPTGTPDAIFYWDGTNEVLYKNNGGVWTIDTAAAEGGFSGVDVLLSDGDDTVIGRVVLAAGTTITVNTMGVTMDDGASEPDVKIVARRAGVAFATVNNDGAEQLTAGNTADGAALITFHIENDSGTDNLVISGFVKFTVC